MSRGLPFGALAAVALLATSCGSGAPSAPPPGSTLVRALGDPDGDGVLNSVAGLPLLPRTELAPAAPVKRVLATLAQISDPHIVDEESPLRVEVIDRLGGSLTSSFRPQEALSTQVLAAAIQSVNTLAPDAVLVTGDIADNAQSNELGWAITALGGGTVTPDSGSPGYVGVQETDSADPFFYRPDIDAPRQPGLLGRAQEAFASPGLTAPWLPAVSNHDVLVQGLVRPDAALGAQAASGKKLTRPSEEATNLARRSQLDPARIERLLTSGTLGEFRDVPADPKRRLLAQGEAVARLAKAAGVPTQGPLLMYDRQIAKGIRVVVLDTADRTGTSVGVLRAPELRWLEQTLGAHSGDQFLIVSPTPLEDTRGGDQAFKILDRTPGVVAVLAGDTHRSRIRPRQTATGGYWLVRAPSLADYPQQVRAYRLVELTDGGLALETWLIDHAGDSRQGGSIGLAGVSRDLAFLDTQGGRPRGWSGTLQDQNATLYLPKRRA